MLLRLQNLDSIILCYIVSPKLPWQQGELESPVSKEDTILKVLKSSCCHL